MLSPKSQGLLCASNLYARSQGRENSGTSNCHWCASLCERTWAHDDEQRLPFQRPKVFARCPSNPYICAGCWLWRRLRVPANFLEGGFADSQCALNHSWWITDHGAWAISRWPSSKKALYDLLLHPPLRFCLALLDGENLFQNQLQQTLCNDMDEMRGDTLLRFTINNVPHTYTVYELEQSILYHDPEGKEPGISALVRLLGEYIPDEDDIVLGKRARGRPRKEVEEAKPSPGKILRKK